MCAAAGTAWLLQFIEDMQQSRDFHKTCELILPNEAATIPEVILQFLPQNLIQIVNLPSFQQLCSTHIAGRGSIRKPI